MMLLHEMRNMRDGLLNKAEAIIDAAELQDRGLTADEQRQIDEINGRASRLNERIQHKSAAMVADEADKRAAEQPAPKVEPKPEKRDGDDRPQFRTKDGRVVEARAHGERLYRGGEEIPSIGHAARSIMGGGDREKRNWVIGTDPEGGFILQPEISLGFFDKARSQSRLLEAGALTVPMETSEMVLAVLEGDVETNWRSEGGTIATSTGLVGNMRLRARSLAARTRISRELFMDAPNAPVLVNDALGQRMAEVFDQAMLAGTGKGSQPRGLLNTSGLSEVTEAGDLDYDNWIDANAIVRGLSVEPESTIMAPVHKAKLAKLRGSDGQYMTAPTDYSDLRQLVSAQMPSDAILCGNFRTCILGIRELISVQIGQFDNDAKEGMISIIAHARADFGVARPERVVKITNFS